MTNLGSDTKPGACPRSPAFAGAELSGASIIAVHGFGFDPRKPAGHRDNPETRLFPLWRNMLAREVMGHGWYSVPPGIERLWEAWRSSRRDRINWNRYCHAWHLADAEAARLCDRVTAAGGPVDLVCHSLGSRVVLSALGRGGPNVRRVIFLDGAEHCRRARAIAGARPDVAFLNIVVRTDGVLRWLGSLLSPRAGWHPTIGQRGLRRDAPANWLEIVLDDRDWQDWGRSKGWVLRGNNRCSFADHWYSYEWRGNWPLYREFLKGSLW